MRGQAAWEALQAGMRTRLPLCIGDDRFVSDDLSPGDVIELTELCSLCPLKAACEAYTIDGRPAAGWWAGRKRP